MNPYLRAFLYGLSQTFGIAPIKKEIPTIEEQFKKIESDLGKAIERAKRK